MRISQNELALLVDDDSDFILIAKKSFRKLGIELEATSNFEIFLDKLRLRNPRFCLIDLNFNGVTAGFSLIMAIRKKIGHDLPLFVVSSTSDVKSIAHAIEVGANDYFLKPLDMDLVATKLGQYVKNDDLKKYSLPCYRLPEDGVDAEFSLNFQIESMDEYGLTLVGPTLLSKGTVFKLSGEFLQEGMPGVEEINLKVLFTWASEDRTSFSSYAEFYNPTEALLNTFRRFVHSKK